MTAGEGVWEGGSRRPGLQEPEGSGGSGLRPQEPGGQRGRMTPGEHGKAP